MIFLKLSQKKKKKNHHLSVNVFYLDQPTFLSYGKDLTYIPISLFFFFLDTGIFLLISQAVVPKVIKTATSWVRRSSNQQQLMMRQLNPTFRYTHFNTLKKTVFGKHCGKSEIAQKEQFHLFPQCFLCNLHLKIL